MFEKTFLECGLKSKLSLVLDNISECDMFLKKNFESSNPFLKVSEDSKETLVKEVGSNLFLNTFGKPNDQNVTDTQASSPVNSGSRPTYAVCLFDFKKQEENDLEFLKEDIIALKTVNGNSWCFGRNLRTLKTGYCPSNYLRILNSTNINF